MDEKEKKEEGGFYICKVCGNKKRPKKDKENQKVECCGEEMLKPEKGAWDF
jgi:hypothetical protein